MSALPQQAARDETRAVVWRNWLVLLVVWAAFYASYTLLRPALLDDADSVHAEVAREMLLRHDYVTLYANGIRYLEKAPLYYWAMALAMKLFGVSAAAARLPLAFAVAALAWLSESFARRLYGVRAGLYAGLIALSSFGIFIFSRINIPDVLVCVLLTAALFCYLQTEAEERPGRGLCWGFAAACALDVLTKGLIGIVFPLAIVGLHLLLTRGWRGGWNRVWRLHPLTSVAVFLVIAVPWHVLAGLANPSQGNPGGVTFAHGHFAVPLPTDGKVHGWTWFYFVNEQVLRYLNLRVPRDYDTVPLWLFLGLILVWLMPWSAYLPAAFAWAWRRVRAGGSAEKLMLIWTVLPLLFFAFSTRQEYYVLPALPPMILGCAGFLAHRERTKVLAERHRVSAARCAAVLAVLGLTAAATCVYLLVHSRIPAPGTDLSDLLRQNPGDYALSFGHFLDLNARAMGMFRMPLALTAVAFGILLPLAYLLRRPYNYAVLPLMLLVPDRERRRELSKRIDLGPHVNESVLTTAAAAFLFLVAAHMGLVIFSPTLSSAQLAAAIAPQVKAGIWSRFMGSMRRGRRWVFICGVTICISLRGGARTFGMGRFFRMRRRFLRRGSRWWRSGRGRSGSSCGKTRVMSNDRFCSCRDRCMWSRAAGGRGCCRIGRLAGRLVVNASLGVTGSMRSS